MEDDYGYEMEAIEAERLTADMEMAELQAAGREWYRAIRRAKALFDAGDLERAAQACRHGWGYPLNSLAAKMASDPRVLQRDGWRCLHCGSVVSDLFGPVTVMVPCEIQGAWGER